MFTTELIRPSRFPMIDWNLTEFFLTGLVAYGPVVLAGALFLGTLGVSLPGTIFVLAAGAFVRQGILSPWTAFPLALVAAVLGDSISFGIGYAFRGWVNSRLEGSGTFRRVRSLFYERCGLAVYLTRFILTPLAVPVNLLSGGTGYPFRWFLLYDVFGEITWLILYGSLGFVFASQWSVLGEVLNNVFGMLLGVVLAAIGIYLLVPWKQLPVSFVNEPT